MPRMTDELKRYQEAKMKVDAATVEFNAAAVALAARVAQEGGPLTRRGRKPGPKPRRELRDASAASGEGKAIDLKAARAKRRAS